MKSLQSFFTAGVILLTATVAFGAQPFGSGTPAPSLLGPRAETSPEVLGLINEGKAAYQKGEMDKAKAAFEMAYGLDSRNAVVIGFLRQIKAAEKTLPPKVDRERQLSGVIIPKLNFKEATLGSALDFVKKTVAEQTGGKQTVSFVVQMPAEQVNTMTVTLSLQNIPASEAIRYLADLAHATVTYDAYAVVFKPKVSVVPVPPAGVTTVPQSAPNEPVAQLP